MRRPLAALAGLLSTVIMLPGVPAEAAAPAASGPSVVVSRDARHDVRRVVDALHGPSRVHRLPHRRVGDITRLRVTHGAGAVTVRVNVLTLGRVRRDGFGPLVRLHLPRTTVNALVVPERRGAPSVETYLSDGGDLVACTGASAAFLRGPRAVRVTVPRSCLGDPSQVRVNVETLVEHRGPGSTHVTVVDQAPGRAYVLRNPRVTAPAFAPAGAVVQDAPPPVVGRHHA